MFEPIQVVLGSWGWGLHMSLFWRNSKNFDFWAYFDPLDHTISLERDKIKLKGSGRKFIIPLYPKELKSWAETWDEAHEAQRLYQVINKKIDNVKRKNKGEILVGSPLSIRQNSNTK